MIAKLNEIPRSLASEDWVLGAFLKDPRLIPADFTPYDFFEPEGVNGWIMRAIQSLRASKKPVDILSVSEWLRAANMTEAVGAPVKLQMLVSDIGTTVGAPHHIETVRNASARRAFIDACAKASEMAIETRDLAALSSRAESTIKSALAKMRGGSAGSMVPMSSLADREFFALGERHDGATPAAMSTGLKALDDILGGGFYPGDLVVIGGRPAMGKSALSGGIAVSLAKQGRASTTHNLEMGQSQQFLRVWSAEAKVPMPWLRNPKSSQSNGYMSQATAGIARISEFGKFLYVQHEDKPVTVEQIGDDARRLHEQVGLSAAFVDYIGLVRASDGRAPREQQISHVSRELKSLAKELGIPVVAMSQVNRQCETRTDKRPVLADLRESGAVEQDADVVLFCYRDEYYYPDSPDKGVAEVIVAKQRNGGTGTARVAFVAPYALFADLAPHAGNGW